MKSLKFSVFWNKKSFDLEEIQPNWRHSEIIASRLDLTYVKICRVGREGLPFVLHVTCAISYPNFTTDRLSGISYSTRIRQWYVANSHQSASTGAFSNPSLVVERSSGGQTRRWVGDSDRSVSNENRQREEGTEKIWLSISASSCRNTHLYEAMISCHFLGCYQIKKKKIYIELWKFVSHCSN